MKILTERMDAHRTDSHTINRYEATGGYSALRKGIEIGREAIAAEVQRKYGARLTAEMAATGDAWFFALAPRDESGRG